MGFDDVNKALNSKGSPSSKFEDVGDVRSGYLKDVALQVQTDTKGEVQFQKDGKTPKEQLVITWQTDERDPERDGDTGMRKLYCSWRLESAIRTAFRAAGADGLEPEAFLKVKRGPDEKVKGPVGTVVAKTYEVLEYRRPSFQDRPSTPADDTFEKTVTEAKPSIDPAKVALAKQLFSSGVEDIAVLTQASGLTAEQVKDAVLI